KVVINEIMVTPGVNYGPGADDISGTFQSLYTGQEWIELYNPSPCDPVDISCYILGDKSSPTSSGAISFPQGTIIPPLGFLVVGGSNAPNVNIVINNFRSTPNFVGTNNWRFNNVSGSCALYDKNLQIVDGVYWGPSQNDINDRVNSVGDAFEYTLPYPTGQGCNYPSGAIIPAPSNNASQFEYIGNVASTSVGAQTIGKTTYRSTDAGNTWIVGGVGAANNTPGACNGICTPPFTGGGTGGTCNGSVSVTVSGGVGTFTYDWKDQANNSVGTTSSVSNLCAGTYSVKVTDNTTNCSNTANVTVSDNIPQVTPAFTQVAAICSGGTFILPTTSTNNITGSWAPAIDNTQTKTYTFTPDAGQCATTTTMTVTVNPSVTPVFTQVAAICSGGTFILPTTSTNNITGSWSPAIDNTQTKTYTFTPDAGQCATTTTMTVTVNPSVTPLFTQVAAICSGGTFTLPTTSTNNITGSWSPAIDNTQTKTYTFTPDPGQCATTTTMTVTVSSSIDPIFNFGNSLNICNGKNIPVLPGTSDNSISGTWNPSVISNTQSNSYVFTPVVSACATPFTLNVTVTTLSPTPSSTPNTVCNGTGGTPGGCVPQGTGVVINEVRHWPPTGQGIIANGTEYIELYNPTCNPIDISCFIIGARSVPNSNPGSTLATGGSIILPQGTILAPKSHFVIGTSLSSTNPASIDFKTDQNTSFYCATGNFVLANSDGWVALYDKAGIPIDAIYWTTLAGQGSKISSDDDYDDNPCTPSSVTGCSTSGITLSSAAQIFANSPSKIFYVGQTTGTPSNLPTTTTGNTFSRVPDGGAWQRDVNPSIDGSNCNNGQCDVSTPGTAGTCNGSVSVTVGGGSGTYTYEWKNSSNDVIGAGSSVTNLCAGTYTVKVTDQSTNCDSTINVTVVDNIPQVTPTFNSYGPFCQGDILPAVILPTTSINGIKGTWNPASLSTAVAGDISYSFTPDAGQCADPVTIIVKVNPRVTPTFPYGTTLTICSGDPTPNLLGLSSNNILGTWNPTPVSNTQSDVYTFTPLGNACANQTTFTVTVIQRPNVSVRPDTTLYHNAVYPGDIFSGLPVGSTVSWTNSNPAIGLPSSGSGNVPAFTAINIGSNPVTATITVNSTNGNCAGTTRTYKITVLPLNRDVFVPNVFSPNGDGRNDQLLVFGNYITKLEMRIFNQWGEMIKVITNPATGWDGTHKGKAQPVGVYVYTLRATLADGTEVNKKGSITLVR
ncbi:MAG: lamin tail domain-containing protein, partial [Bacteroidota bacterium]